jgi:2-dehydro-3-deoxygluconokinase
MSGVASIGECMLELSGGPADWRMGHAGDTFNTLWALRALLPDATPTDFVTAFGDDPFSQSQIGFMEAAGIGVADSPRIPGARPGLYAITLDGAERSFTYWRSDAAARQLASDPVRLTKSLSDRELVYISGITLAILTEDARTTLLDAISTARSNGALIAFDPNYRSRLWADASEARAAIGAALECTDIALPTFPDEVELNGDADQRATAARMASAGVGEIVVKNGSEAALLHFGGEEQLIAAPKARAVDTTGAGDSFNGAYLAARVLGFAAEEAAMKAHRVAGAVIGVRGALAPFETLRAAFVD